MLLLLEHTPVITLGRNARRNNVLASDELLKQRGVELFECDRGGDVTYHGPGQLVGYPIFDLRSFLGPDGQKKTLGAVDYVRRLEEALVRTCADYGIPTERVAGMTGVWTQIEALSGRDIERSETVSPLPKSRGAAEGSPNEQGKIAAIGVHISRGVTSHGFALNVTNQPSRDISISSFPAESARSRSRRWNSELRGAAHAPSRRASASTKSRSRWRATSGACSIRRSSGWIRSMRCWAVRSASPLARRKSCARWRAKKTPSGPSAE